LAFGAGTFSTARMAKLLSGLPRLRPGLVGSPRPPMYVSQEPRRSAGQGVRSGRGAACELWSMVGHIQFPLEKLGRHATLAQTAPQTREACPCRTSIIHAPRLHHDEPSGKNMS
jgi:hypothetical protein